MNTATELTEQYIDRPDFLCSFSVEFGQGLSGGNYSEAPIVVGLI